MPYFEYSQNNSGGSFRIDDAQGIGPRVWILADSSEHANDLARQIGIYFDGISKGWDCECCGDRWSECWNDKGSDLPVINLEYDFNWHDKVYVHEGKSFRTIDKPK